MPKKQTRKPKSTSHPKIAELVNKHVCVITTVSNGWPISGLLSFVDKSLIVISNCRIGKNAAGSEVDGERILMLEQVVSINRDPLEK